MVSTICGRAFKKILRVLSMSLEGNLISRLVEKVGKSHPRTALGIAHKTYYGAWDVRFLADCIIGWKQCVIME